MFSKNLASALMALTFVLLLALWQWLSRQGGQREILPFVLFAVVVLAGFFAISARVMARYGIDDSSE